MLREMPNIAHWPRLRSLDVSFNQVRESGYEGRFRSRGSELELFVSAAQVETLDCTSVVHGLAVLRARGNAVRSLASVVK